MRCRRAQKLMAAAADGMLDARERPAFEAHVAACAACADELVRTARLFRTLASLPMEAPVPERIEQATLRRIRHLEAEEAESGPRAWWRAWSSLPVFAAATVAAVVLAVGIATRTADVPVPGPVAESPRGPRVATAPGRTRIARTESRPASEPPPALAAAPDLFVNLPLLKNFEKVEHFDAIQTTTLDDETPSGEEQSNG
jgi:anti-sigma factor RsiW